MRCLPGTRDKTSPHPLSGCPEPPLSPGLGRLALAGVDWGEGWGCCGILRGGGKSLAAVTGALALFHACDSLSGVLQGLEDTG